MQALLGTFTHRPYVFLLLASYLIVATLHLGAKRTAIITVVGYWIAWTSEICSITWGFPYGLYHYVHDPSIQELWVFGVPFFDSISYTFLAYASWSTALVLVGGMRGEGTRLHIPDEKRWRFSFRTIFLASFLMMLIDVVIDPVSHRGKEWFLGEIYYYATPGPYFDVPFSNFAGWFLVGLIMTTVIGWVDKRMENVEEMGRRELPLQPLFGPGLYFGTVIFILSVAASIGSWDLFWAGCFVQSPLMVWVIYRCLERPLDEAVSVSPTS